MNLMITQMVKHTSCFQILENNKILNDSFFVIVF